MEFTGKVAIVTGGTGGIGLGIAKAFAAKGAAVCVADIDGAKCESVAKSLGGKSFGVTVDVAGRESVDRLMREVADRAGGVDILINNAGVFSANSLLDVTEAEFDHVMGVNARGLFFMMQAAARQMVAQKRGGKIVNTASGAGRVGGAASPVYSASKAAVISFTQSAARTLISHGINVNAIAPGPIRTPMWDEVERQFQQVNKMAPGEQTTAMVSMVPARRMGTPEDLVGAVLFLCSDAASYVVGQTLNVDGGFLMN